MVQVLSKVRRTMEKGRRESGGENEMKGGEREEGELIESCR